MSKKIKQKLSILFIFFAILCFICAHIQNAQARKYPLDQKTIFKVIGLLKNEYFFKIDPNQMLNGAISGINEYIKKKFSIKSDIINKIPKDQDISKSEIYFKEEYSGILKKYHDKINEEDLVYSSLKGMLGILNEPPYDDPYTIAMSPKEFRILNEQMTGGNFAGVGVYIQLDKKNNNQLTVVEPIENTPAYNAGLKSGDQIIKIDGEPTEGIDIDVAVQKIRGPVGTSVTLTIKRTKAEAFTKNIPITRSQIHVKSAVPKLLNKKIGYIKLRIFARDTNEELHDAIDKLLKKDVKALVLDLRNNGGGFINSAVDVCSKFMPKGSLVVSVVNYRKHTRETYRAYDYKHIELPLIVLINQYSASASEIVAGALQDTQRAILIGEKSFGKGSVQNICPLPNEGALKYTIALYLTPKGRNINKTGINPDYEVKMDVDLIDSKDDTQLKKAVEIIQEKYNI